MVSDIPLQCGIPTDISICCIAFSEICSNWIDETNNLVDSRISSSKNYAFPSCRFRNFKGDG